MARYRQELTRLRNCKIVATLGPASDAPDRLAMLAAAGVNVFRINFSHGDPETHRKKFETIRNLEQRLGRPFAILADLQGPKIRCAPFMDGGVDLKFHQTVDLILGSGPAPEGEIHIPHPEIFAATSAGDQLLFDDGRLAVEVLSCDGERATARVSLPGRLTDRKGINVPDKRLPISAITAKDRTDLHLALEEGADFIALSFVQHVEDVREARALIGDRAGILTKIEKPSAIEHLTEILTEADAVMVARGDLGVELPPEQVPILQRRIVREARRLGRPVIVATQMLESMIDSPTPTRAEASDVATAVYQGADAVMLSAESAVGRHPPTVVAIMDRIIRAIEEAPDFDDALKLNSAMPDVTTADAISHAAWEVSNVLDCRAIVAFTSTGSTAKRISRTRPKAPILMLTPSAPTARRGVLMWGVEPVIEPDIDSYETMLETAKRIAAARGVPDGERIVITAGVPFGRPGKTNLVQITRVGAGD